MASANNLGSIAHSFLDPLDHSARRFLTDQRTDVGAFFQDIADFQLLHTRNQHRNKFVVSALLHKNPLHGDTRLPGIAKAAGYAAARAIFRIPARPTPPSAAAAHP